MALNDQQRHFVDGLIAWANDQRALQDRGKNLYEDYNQHGHADIPSNDLIAAYPHLDIQKIINAITAQQAVETALGDGVSGQRVNLINMKG